MRAGGRRQRLLLQRASNALLPQAALGLDGMGLGGRMRQDVLHPGLAVARRGAPHAGDDLEFVAVALMPN